jgi:hypothetical protein
MVRLSRYGIWDSAGLPARAIIFTDVVIGKKRQAPPVRGTRASAINGFRRVVSNEGKISRKEWFITKKC